MKSLEFIKQTYVHQFGKYSSGLSCLTSIAGYHDGTISQDYLIHLSGTSPLGTTVLGLYQAANKVGFHAEAFKGTIEGLKTISDPVILDVTMDNTLKHFVVCYGFDGQFLIGDPAWGLMQYGEDELSAVWKSKIVIQLTPNELFVKTKVKIKQKRKWTLDLIRGDVPIFCVIAALDLIIASLSLVPLIFVQKLIDGRFPSQIIPSLVTGIALLALALTMRFGFNHVKEIVLAIQRREFRNRIFISYESKLFYLKTSFFESLTTEQLISWRKDVKSIVDSTSYVLRASIVNVLMVILPVGFIFIYNFSLGLLALISICMYGFLGTRNLRSTVDRKQECNGFENRNESNYLIFQHLMSIIQGFCKEKMFSNIAREASTLLQNKIYAQDILESWKKTKLDVVMMLFMIPVMVTTAAMSSFQNLTAGEILSAFILVLTIYFAARRLIASVVQIRKVKSIVDRMFEFASLEREYDVIESEAKSSENSGDFSLLMKNISFRFNGNRQLFKNISFSVKRGELIIIFGEAGSGKSSLFRILQRFNDVESGQIIFNQQDWRQIDIYTWRKKIAVVPQSIKLMNRTLIENLCFENLVEEAGPVMEFCNKYHFDKYFASLPQGYLTLVGEDGINLPRAYRQLVAIARALYKKPELLLLDDATNCMDKKMTDFTWNLLNSIKEDVAIIFLTNRITNISKTDATYVLHKGEIILHSSEERSMQFGQGVLLDEADDEDRDFD